MSKPKVLFFDIETTPNLAYVWGKYQQDVIAYKKEKEVLSVAWKWQGEDKVHFVKKQEKSDKSLIKTILRLFHAADMVIAHNGDAFDIKIVKARAIYHELPPTAIIQSVDTRNMARKYFGFNSNKLDDLGQYLQLGRKVKNPGIELWLQCMGGSKRAWKLMEKYNKQDVVLLEKVYDRMLPWMEDSHPNLTIINGQPLPCNKCGSFDLVKAGNRRTSQGIKQKWQCRKCNGYLSTSMSRKVGVSK